MKNDKQSHALRNGIIITVSGGLIVHILSETIRGLSLKVLTWAWKQIIWILNALISGYSVPGWILLIAGVLALIGIILVCRNLISQKKPYIKYTEDMLEGVKWRWSWIDNDISRLACFCPTCDAILIPFEGLECTFLICEQCPPNSKQRGIQITGRIIEEKEISASYLEDRVKREIYRRIRTGQYNEK